MIHQMLKPFEPERTNVPLAEIFFCFWCTTVTAFGVHYLTTTAAARLNTRMLEHNVARTSITSIRLPNRTS
jgi:hypothetical protein